MLKNERRALFQDAQRLFKTIRPKARRDGNTIVAAWDQEGFNTTAGVDAPIRVLHTEEDSIKRERIKGKWKKKIERRTWWWAATIPKDLLPTRGLWWAGHSRWDVENGNFNQLSSYWPMDHCFKHHSTAIVNFILVLFVAFVPAQCFYRRNLKPQPARLFTLIGLVSQLYLGLAQPGLTAPWRKAKSKAPP